MCPDGIVLPVEQIYFLHETGHIRHVLVLDWGGESTATMELRPWLRRGIGPHGRKTDYSSKYMVVVVECR